ncbi:MAG: hypothetical protein ACPGRD_10530 [Planktomarina sp.]
MFFPSVADFIETSAPWMPWDQLTQEFGGFDTSIRAAIVAGVAIVVGFVLNAIYFVMRTRNTAEQFNFMAMAGGYFWGLVFVGIAFALYMLAYYTFVETSPVSSNDTPRGRVRVHWVLALLFYGYFWLIDTIGSTFTALIILACALISFMLGLSSVSNGDTDDEDDA